MANCQSQNKQKTSQTCQNINAPNCKVLTIDAIHTPFAQYTSCGRIHMLKHPEPILIQKEEIRIQNFLNFEIQIRSESASMQLHFVHFNKFNEYFDKHQQWV